MRLKSRLQRGARFALWDHGGLTTVLTFALVVRLLLLRWWSAAPFGDVVNFVTIATKLAHFEVPVAEKRLPFYPLLILLTHSALPGIRWETAAIGVAITMSLATLVLTYAIGRTLGLRKVPVLAGTLLLSGFPPFLAYSIRGYADTTFVALLLAAVLALLHAHRRAGWIAAGPLLGALALTRYEGVVAGAVLALLFAIRLRQHPRRLALGTSLLLLTLLPYVGIAARSGRSLLPQAYLSQAGAADQGYGAASFGEFRERHWELWKRNGAFALWKTPRWLLGEARDSFLTLHHSVVDLFSGPRSATALLAIPGLLLLLFRRSWKTTLALVLPFVAVSIPIAWWAPYIRYDAFLFPLMALLASAGLHAILRIIARATHGGWGAVVFHGASVGLLLITFFVWTLGFIDETRLSLRKSRYRELGFSQALLHAEALPGTIAFEDRRGMTDVYFGGRAVYGMELFGDTTAPKARWEKLRTQEVAYVVVSTGGSAPFDFIKTAATEGRAEEVARYKVEQGDHDINEAVIYHLTFTP